jgi:hypothetical protein
LQIAVWKKLAMLGTLGIGDLSISLLARNGGMIALSLLIGGHDER